jgi:hypothetical protein
MVNGFTEYSIRFPLFLYQTLGSVYYTLSPIRLEMSGK